MELERFYGSKRWQAFRESLILTRTNEDGLLICDKCGLPINKRYDLIAHHRIELTEDNVNDYTVSLNPDNIQLVHFRCHNKIHSRWQGGSKGGKYQQRVWLVYGSPCSGKSSWVQEVAGDEDLIIDIDKIWECITASDKYHKVGKLKTNVFGVRDCLIDQIRTRTGLWRNAYVIGGYPLKSDRDRLCDLLNALPIFIDEPKEICLSRAVNEDWKEYIEDWFEEFVS